MKEQEFVEFIVKELVDHEEDINITVVEGERLTLIELRVHKDDIGKVIGRYGNIAKAIRTMIFAMANKTDKRVVLEIMD